MKRTIGIDRRHIITAGILLVGLVAPRASADLFVNLLATDLGGGVFQYEATIENTGPEDFILVSIADAPPADPLIGATLAPPPGFLTSYDSGLGYIDFLENTDLFAAGTTTSGFSFQSLGPPLAFFTAFEGFTTNADFHSGAISTTVVPVPSSGVLMICGLASAWAKLARRRSTTRA